MKLRIFLILWLAAMTTSVWGQTNVQPGPEVKKLDYFVGNWASEGTIAQGPWGMGGRFSAAGTNEWMPGNFFVQGHAAFKMPPEVGGEGKEVAFMGYDTDQNLYTYDSFNSQGRRETSKGTVNGDTWTWNSTATYGGQDIAQKMTMKILSANSYSFKFEVSLDGGKTWMTFMDGKATKK